MGRHISNKSVKDVRFEDSALKTTDRLIPLYPLSEEELRHGGYKGGLVERRAFGVRSRPFLDKFGHKLSWDYITRSDETNPVTVVVNDETKNDFLFVVQPRIPLENMIVSFPSGLIEPDLDENKKLLSNRSDIDVSLLSDDKINKYATAIREVKEETGYDVPMLRSMSSPLPKSAGLTTESNTLVRATIAEKKKGKSREEKTEDIYTFWANPKKFMWIADNLDPKEVQVSDGTYSFMKGYTTALEPLCKIIENQRYFLSEIGRTEEASFLEMDYHKYCKK